ncbi:MAG: glycoside hydrolase family 78 protein [Acidobacteriota bacterium]|nr:glycoside hydrolase family 78 protein [Acidobacteriota bacterium]
MPQSARLRITASDRYLLYINGINIGRGPARSDPRRKSYDTYDAAKYLIQGKNSIAIRAYHYGTQNSPGEPKPRPGSAYALGGRAGLWAELEMKNGDGQFQLIGTDDSWLLYPARAWDREVELINVLVGSTEIYNATADPADWMETNFNDASWERAWVIPQRALEWVFLEPRDIPLMREREIFPTKIVKMAEVIDLSNRGQRDIPEFLNGEIHFPLENALAQNANALLRNDNQPAVFQSKFARVEGIRAPVIIVDFGRQVFGFPRIRMTAEAETIVDMTYGQQLAGERIPPGLRYGDRYISRKGDQTWEVAQYKQFRYLQITPRSTYAPISIESISLNEYGYPADQKGEFGASDQFLTKLWQACVDTTYLQMEDTIVCDAHRERVAWSTGDGSHGVHGIYIGYGDIPLTDHFFRSFPLSDRGNGMLRMSYPPDHAYLPRNIPQFLLQWSTRVRDQYLFTGRKRLLEELYPSVQRQIDWFEPHRDEMGLLRDLPYWNFWDWTPNDLRGANFTTNALYVKALEDAAWSSEQLGEKHDAFRWRKIADDIRGTMRRVFWNEHMGRFEDSHFRGKLTGIASEVGNAYALLYGIASTEQVPRIGKAFLDKSQELVEVSPLYAGYVFDGLIEAGFSETALQIIRDRFAPMINSTDTPTIWEGWFPFTGSSPIESDVAFLNRKQIRPFGVRSLVHTGGVLTGFVMTTQILGVKPSAPGFAEFTIHPHPGDLDSAWGVVPTPRGDIRVKWKKGAGLFTLEAQIPDTTNAEVVLERNGRKNLTLLWNNKVVKINSTKTDPETNERADSNSIRLRVGAGKHLIELRG